MRFVWVTGTIRTIIINTRAPYIPPIQNLNRFPNEITHSKWYRNPSDFANRVCSDLTLEMHHHRKFRFRFVAHLIKAYDIAHAIAEFRVQNPGSRPPLYQAISSNDYKFGIDPRDKDVPAWAQEISILGRLIDVSEDGLVLNFSCGRTLKAHEDVEVILFGTGYLYSFPFCQSQDQPWATWPLIKPLPGVNGRDEFPLGGLRVHNLDYYKTFYTPDPTIMFLCLATHVSPFCKP